MLIAYKYFDNDNERFWETVDREYSQPKLQSQDYPANEEAFQVFATLFQGLIRSQCAF
jgi:hypothetical protein